MLKPMWAWAKDFSRWVNDKNEKNFCKPQRKPGEKLQEEEGDDNEVMDEQAKLASI